MLKTNQLLEVKQTNENIVTYLQSTGTIFKIFDLQDSGCTSYGVEVDGQKWFVKYADQPHAITALQNAISFNTTVKSKYLPLLLNWFTASDGLALVYEWVEGDVLGSPQFTGEAGRSNPLSPFYRLQQLPVDRVITMLNAIYEIHVMLASEGFVAVDFYDGCIIYDFSTGDVHLMDFDHYAQGAFVLDTERLPGSSRFMAPEEFAKGSLIDERTNVFTMGAAAFVFLGGATDRSLEKWRAPEALYHVALKAVSPERAERFSTIHEFYEHWRAALTAPGE